MSDNQKSDQEEDSPPQNKSSSDKAEQKKEPEKKSWKLAPRTGQRHANPFDRKPSK